ncbi:MAG: hypothetical protein H6735_27855 [Alphaproteobacteria bacterium]|nr:hypothetical protein [Alphaproteobacteria bacterium]
MDDRTERIRADLQALSGVAHRYAGTEGEREMLQQVRSRLPAGARSRIEGFVAYTSPALVVGAHAAALLVSGLVAMRWPLLSALLCGLSLASLVAEGTGRYSVLRRVLPKAASYNLVWRPTAPPVEEGDEASLGTVVIAVPLDIPRWRPERPRWPKRPMFVLFVTGVVMTSVVTLRALAEPWGRPTQGMYAGSLAILAAAVGLGIFAHRRATGLHEDASGPAALLDLGRRIVEQPIAGLDVWCVFTGCAYAYQNGMHAFLAMRGGRLRKPLLVLAMDEPGRGELHAVVSEGPLWRQHHRPTGPALVERLRWAGLDLRSTDTAQITNARAAMLWGHRALALAGGGGVTTAEDTIRAVDVAEAIVRLYADDLRRVPALPESLRHLLPTPAAEEVAEDPPTPTAELEAAG